MVQQRQIIYKKHRVSIPIREIEFYQYLKSMHHRFSQQSISQSSSKNAEK